MFRRPNVDLFLGVPFKGQHMGSFLRQIEELLFGLKFLDGASKAFLGLFHLFYVSGRSVPTKDVARFISQRVESKKKPAILSLFCRKSRLFLESETSSSL